MQSSSMRVARVSETQSLGISTVEERLLGTVEALPGNEHPESSPDRAGEIDQLKADFKTDSSISGV